MKTFKEIVHEIGHTDKMTRHAYVDFYDPLIDRFRYTAKNILEVGVVENHGRPGGGSLASLGLFFENANVYGIDKNERCHKGNLPIKFPSNVKLLIGNAYDPEFLDEQIGGIKWDIVLDDGSHRKEHQAVFLNYFYDKLTQGGVLLIEDVLGDAVDYVYDNFEGDISRLSLVDRTRTKNRKSKRRQEKSDERIFLYM